MSYQFLVPAHVLVLGLGETGLASALWCLKNNARVTLVDTRENPAAWQKLHAGYANVSHYFGEHALQTVPLEDVDAIVLSPGLSPNQAEIKHFLQKAKQHKIEIIGEVELFARALKQLAQAQNYDYQVLAVTGTNGKTTVTSMVASMLAAAGFTVQAAGNISPSVLTALMAALEQEQLPQVWVLELSSFQMHTTHSLHPQASVVMNVTQDHLDWHVDMADYAAHKAALLQSSQIKIINRDDAMVSAMVADIRAPEVRSFGLQAPTWAGDFGLEQNADVLWLSLAQSDTQEETISSKKKTVVPALRGQGASKRLMPIDAMAVKGLHNALNAMAALALCQSIKIPLAPLLNALRVYQAQPHRMNFVRSVQGVEFINDSKGTNVGATQAGLEGLSQPIILIAGGLGKGQDFTPLVPALKQKVKALLLIGRDAHIIAEQVAAAQVQTQFCDSLEEAVQASMQLAQSGDVVLFSPACASMDMFRNYGHRGEVFVEAVRDVALDHGEIA
ncbi:UDP-N-acetylmuramoyl-L-alanine--D-glutamate ligase [Brackiella oedipodis]|uniref:UDP-N-acetylmuramoyl-L-alanine--D-glutamate ligase n=1 Tax=Brackiella oedipodis TaxID=124225 RepID=UPI00048C1695|nr:UDP-N-acetylmuramoyl-L-alanine--D-glutamate ligase [Brackiella oedipodis]